MFVHRNNLTKAKQVADELADYFSVTYYVVSTSMGLHVEREKPEDVQLIVHTATPKEKP